MIMAPTRMIPWMALLPDMSGVCRMLGTLEMTSKPTKAASTKMTSMSSGRRSSCRAPASRARVGAWRTGATRSDAGGGRRCRRRSRVASSAVAHEQPEQVLTLRAYTALAVAATLRGQVAGPDDQHPVVVDLLAVDR